MLWAFDQLWSALIHIWSNCQRPQLVKEFLRDLTGRYMVDPPLTRTTFVKNFMWSCALVRSVWSHIVNCISVDEWAGSHSGRLEMCALRLWWQCLWKRKQPYVFMGKVCTSSERLTFYVFSYMFYTGETKPSNLQIVQSHWWFWANFGTQLVRNDQNYRQA